MSGDEPAIQAKAPVFILFALIGPPLGGLGLVLYLTTTLGATKAFMMGMNRLPVILLLSYLFGLVPALLTAAANVKFAGRVAAPVGRIALTAGFGIFVTGLLFALKFVFLPMFTESDIVGDVQRAVIVESIPSVVFLLSDVAGVVERAVTFGSIPSVVCAVIAELYRKPQASMTGPR